MSPLLVALGMRVLPGLIKVAEAGITAPKSGETRKGAVVMAFREMIKSAIGSKTDGLDINTPMPTDDAINAQIETVFQALKGSGGLEAATAEAGGIGATQVPVFLLIGGRVQPIRFN